MGQKQTCKITSNQRSQKQQKVGESQSKRAEWKKSYDFIFAVIGASVGLGNVWRFPYLCFKNGGGAFLIPYMVFALCVAIPMVILETSIGQRVRQGIVQSWGIVPVFKGLAVAQCMIAVYSSLSYPVILVWASKYLVSSFSSTLPWSTCNNYWNTAQCVTPLANGQNASALDFNLATFPVNKSLHKSPNITSATTEYFVREILHLSASIEEPGKIVPDLACYLFAMWVVLYFCMFNGIQWMAKVVYVTATLPFVLILIILVRGVTLEGASEGLYYYMVPDLNKLKDPEVWISASTQVLYSYSVGSPALITMATFNKRNSNFWRDSFLIGILNPVVSFASGLAVFSTLGYMANYQGQIQKSPQSQLLVGSSKRPLKAHRPISNTTVEEVVKSGPGLAFIAYPETLSLLPIPQMWSVFFFLTIILLGIDTQFASLESLMALLEDNIKFVHTYHKIVRALMYATMMLIGLSMVDEGGVYVFEIFNNYGMGGWSLFIIVTCESVAIAWLFGFEKYWNGVVDMIGERRGKLWIKISWKYVTPVSCSGMAIYYFCNSEPLKYEDFVYPTWAQCLAQMVAISSISVIPIYALYKIITVWRSDQNYKKLFRKDPSTPGGDIMTKRRDSSDFDREELAIELI